MIGAIIFVSAVRLTKVDQCTEFHQYWKALTTQLYSFESSWQLAAVGLPAREAWDKKPSSEAQTNKVQLTCQLPPLGLNFLWFRR